MTVDKVANVAMLITKQDKIFFNFSLSMKGSEYSFAARIYV